MPKPTFFNLPAAKRARIVELAIDEFAARSYREASLSRIVARAGIAKGSMYQYFDNKLDLYRWLLLEEVGRRKLAHLGIGEATAPGAFFDELAQMIRGGLAFFLAEPRLARLASALLEPTADPELRGMHLEIRRMGQRMMVDRLQSARDRGEVRADLDLEIAAHLLTSALGFGITDALLDRLGIDLAGLLADPARARTIDADEFERLVAGAIAMLRGGLAGPEAQRSV